MLKTVLALLWLSQVALAAPPSSPMSTPVKPKPPRYPPQKQVTSTFKCTGYYESYTCTNTLMVNDCKHSIKLHWPPLKMPGTEELAKTRRTFCSLTITSAESIEERKFPPQKCEQALKLIAAALQGFPEVPWQDAQCTHIGSNDGILLASQRWERPKKQETLGPPDTTPDLEPKAIRLEELRRCKLHHTAKKRMMHCPVLTQVVHSWLRKYLAFFDVGLVIQNDLK